MMKLFFSLAFLLSISTAMLSQEKPTLIYVGDPMCSWCYGIANELESLYIELGDKFDYELVLGGLRPYNTETMSDLGDFLKHHWEDVEKASGQPFKYDILANKEFVYDTEPPSRAVSIVRAYSPKKALPFFKAIQKAFYLDNLNTHDVNTYLSLLKEMDIEIEKFEEKFNSQESKNIIKKDFQRAGSLGVSSFPSLILQVNGITTPIAVGFSTKDKMEERINKVLNNYNDGR